MSRYFTKTLASLEPYTPGEQLKIADIVKLISPGVRALYVSIRVIFPIYKYSVLA